MRNKLFFVAVFLIAVLSLTGCGPTSSHQCHYSSAWENDTQYHWHVCTECNKAGEKRDHRWDSGVVTTPATETALGVMTYTCLDCGYKKEADIPKTGHTTHSYDQKVVNDFYLKSGATCDSGAIYYYSCVCGEKGSNTFVFGEGTGHTFSKEWSYDETAHWHVATCEHDDQVSSFSAHQWNGGVITKQPTETEEGEKTYTCIICKSTKTESVPKLVHSHTYAETWTSDETYHWHASTCGHESGISGKEEHSWDKGVVTKNPTETEAGIKKYTCSICKATKNEVVPVLPHTHTYAEAWTSDDTYHWHTSTCGHENEISGKSEHLWDKGVITVLPTETSEGLKTFTCAICNTTKTEKVPNSSHVCVFNEQVVSQDFLALEADCEHPARYYYSCLCGKKSSETFVSGNALGHSFANYISNNDATCTKDGTKTAKCIRCDAEDTLPDVGSILSHSYVEQVVLDKYFASNADCTHSATYYYSCVCGEKSTMTFEVGNPLEHSFTIYASNNDATCDKDGTKTAKCDRCSETKTVSDAGTKLPHSYSTDWSSDNTYHWHNATCIHSELYSDKESHNWEDTGKIITIATESIEGVKEQKCSVCGKTRNVNTGKVDHVHTYSTEWTYDENYHWHPATCVHITLTNNKEEHDWDLGVINSEPTVYDEGIRIYTCQICGCTREEKIPVKPSYKVCFFDGSELLSAQNIEPGNAAIPPILSGKNGYRFKQWDKAYTNISSNIDIFAEYVEVFLVEIVDSVNGNVVYSDEIDKGGYIKASDISLPNIRGYAFDGYYLNNTKLSNTFTRVVQSDMQIEARYIEQFIVTFIDYDGSVIDIQTVNKGANALDPAHPSRDGYSFMPGSAGWDLTNTNIQKNTTITAIYSINYYMVNFYTPDHLLLDSQKIAYKHFAEEPLNYDDTFFTWNKTIPGYEKQTLYKDPEWDKELGEIIGVTDYVLVYKTKVQDLVLIMDDITISSREIKQDVNKKANIVLSIYSKTETIYGLNLVINYNVFDADGNQVNYIYFDDTFVNNETKENYKNIVKYGEYSKRYSEIVDTKERTIQYVWSTDNDGIQLQYGNNDILTIAFSLSPNIPMGEYSIQITAESYYIDGSLTKITPVIVSGKIIVVE